jgi:tRNA A37 threonylcarbamoyladenosine synthetase subunit TsaC/SUA5/YrdC
VLSELLALHGSALLATTLIAPDETEPLNDAYEIRERFEHQLVAIIDSGACASEPTTVIDLTPMDGGDEPIIVRQGLGSLTKFGL